LLLMAYQVKLRAVDWDVLALTQEGLTFAEQAEDTLLGGLLWHCRAERYTALGEHNHTRQALEEALARVEHPSRRARIMLVLAVMRMGEGHLAELDATAVMLEESAALFEAHGDTLGHAKAAINLCIICSMRSQYDLAMTHLDRSEALFTEVGHVWGQARVAAERLTLMARWGHCHQPEAELNLVIARSRHLVEQSQDPLLKRLVEHMIARVWFERGQGERALMLLQQRPQTDGRDVRWDGQFQTVAGIILLCSNRREEASQVLEEALVLSHHAQNMLRERDVCMALVLLYNIHRKQPHAQLLAERALSLKAAIHEGTEDHSAVSEFIEAFMALGQALAIDPLGHDPACTPWLERVVDAMRTVEQRNQEASTEFPVDQYWRGLFRAMVDALPLAYRAKLWSVVLDPQGERLMVDREGRGFRAPGQRVWTSLEHRPVVMRLLHALIQHPQGLSTVELVTLLYPEETLVFEAGNNRIHKLVSLLRKLGLRSMLKRRQGRYRLMESTLCIIPPETLFPQEALLSP
ncbi:MAG: hypothetical protein AAFS10_20520, partial [Myxococcota bacterium]